MDGFGTWQLESLIAVGGLGEVWRAHRGDEVAAIKRLHTHLVRNDEARELFATEQQLAMGLPRHPGIVHGLEVGDVDGRPYVALELAPGADLRHIITPAATRAVISPTPTTLSRPRAIAIIAAACDAVTHLHRFGWVHGDLSPGNLIVSEADGVVVVDLGVARKIGEAGTVRGTHAYMAPEQVRGGAWTPATDVFALGVVLWELVAGTRLFHRGPTWLSMAAVVEATPPALPDAQLDGIAQAALAKDP
ncbi:MAG: serine/threonine protein kinase, partial [Deltaproteobacteria bacterium]|nr:serine/threonine protein kinase [Deltaproteobacteria bacterium]